MYFTELLSNAKQSVKSIWDTVRPIINPCKMTKSTNTDIDNFKSFMFSMNINSMLLFGASKEEILRIMSKFKYLKMCMILNGILQHYSFIKDVRIENMQCTHSQYTKILVRG